MFGIGIMMIRIMNNGWHNLDGQQRQKPLSIGDYCEVLGKIKTMTAGTIYSCNLGSDVRFGCFGRYTPRPYAP